MCGRYMLTATGAELAALFGLGSVSDIVRRYNIAPGQQAPVVFPEAGERGKLGDARWGIPNPGRAQGSSLLINARAETVAIRPAFREGSRRRRCLIPASGFFEWSSADRGQAPHLFQQDGGAPFAIAGIFEEPDDTTPPRLQLDLFGTDGIPRPAPPTRRFVLLTTAARGVVRDLHDRMPLVLEAAHLTVWLDPEAKPNDIAARIREPPQIRLVSRVVSRRVGSVRNDDPDCLVPDETENVGEDRVK